MHTPNPAYDELRLLLVQIRESEEVAKHELGALLEVSGLPEYAVWTWNMVLEGELAWNRVAAVDGVIIGGAGVHSATNDDDFTDNLIDTIRRIADEEKPLFGSCYGHQIVARALGGEVITDEDSAEVGCHDVTLTDACEGDDVFGGLWASGQHTFPALMGHRDRVSVLPEGGVELATTPVCPNQAYRIAEHPIWTTQFHVELTPKTLVERLERYADIYAPGDDTLQKLEAELRPVPECGALLGAFLDVCVRSAR
ncbi:MAG: type 1 glutamine amidotransferase [Planctomycetota bacterium]